MTAHNVDAEQALLGTCMMLEAPDAFPTAAGLLTAADFYRPAHERIWQAIESLHTKGGWSDPVLVADELGKDLARVGDKAYLAELYGRACPVVAIPHHARLIADAATMRRLETAGQRIAQRAGEGLTDAAELATWSAQQVAAARDERQGVDVLTTDWDTWIHATPEQRTMIIPDLLGEGDRFVLTGHGGLGKSTMLQQIAVCAAAGVPPFDWTSDDPFEPVRVSIIDCENANHLIRTRLWPMVNDCLKLGCDPRPNLFVGGDGQPLDLLNPQNALSLLRTIERDKPGLVYIGPVYKLHNDDPDKESVVKRITDVLDSIRGMGAAIITEAHHTKEGRNGGSLAPSGSNLWTWWPEFGRGLRLVDEKNNMTRRCDLERWRIDRVPSQWPDEVEQSGQLGLRWARASMRESHLITPSPVTPLLTRGT